MKFIILHWSDQGKM